MDDEVFAVLLAESDRGTERTKKKLNSQCARSCAPVPFSVAGQKHPHMQEHRHLEPLPHADALELLRRVEEGEVRDRRRTS
jgi:hypothetical protein